MKNRIISLTLVLLMVLCITNTSLVYGQSNVSENDLSLKFSSPAVPDSVVQFAFNNFEKQLNCLLSINDSNVSYKNRNNIKLGMPLEV